MNKEATNEGFDKPACIINPKNLLKILCTESDWDKLEDLNHLTAAGKYFFYMTILASRVKMLSNK